MNELRVAGPRGERIFSDYWANHKDRPGVYLVRPGSNTCWAGFRDEREAESYARFKLADSGWKVVRKKGVSPFDMPVDEAIEPIKPIQPTKAVSASNGAASGTNGQPNQQANDPASKIASKMANRSNLTMDDIMQGVEQNKNSVGGSNLDSAELSGTVYAQLAAMGKVKK